MSDKRNSERQAIKIISYHVTCDDCGNWISRSALANLLEQLKDKTVREKVASDGSLQVWACLRCEPKISPFDWDLLDKYRGCVWVVEGEGDLSLDDGVIRQRIKLCTNDAQAAFKALQQQPHTYRSPQLHLVYRSVLIQKMRRLIIAIGPKSSYIARHFTVASEKFLRKTPRYFFESYLSHQPVNQCGDIASERLFETAFPQKYTVENLVEWFTWYERVSKHRLPFSIKFKLLFYDRNRSWLSWIIRIFPGRGLYSAETKIVYGFLQDVISRSMLFVDSSKGQVTPCEVTDHCEKQREEFYEIFSSSKYSPVSREKDFPKWFRDTFNAFENGIDELEAFGPGWRSKLAKSALVDTEGNFEELEYHSLDERVLFAYSVFDFVEPETRRIPPYASRHQAVVENKNVLGVYTDFLEAIRLFFINSYPNREELFLKAGAFIKEVFRYRGRKELLGRYQRYRYSSTKSIIAKRSSEKLSKNLNKFSNINTGEKISTTDLSERFFNSSIDVEGCQRQLKQSDDQIIREDYDGPFYLVRLLSPRNDNLLEEVLAGLIIKSRLDKVSEIIGIGRKGGVIGSLLSLTLSFPFSTTTLRPCYDESPLAFGDNLWLLDDCVKSSFTLSQTIENIKYKSGVLPGRGMRDLKIQTLAQIKYANDIIPKGENLIADIWKDFERISSQSNPLFTCTISRDEGVVLENPGLDFLTLYKGQVDFLVQLMRRRVLDASERLKKRSLQDLGKLVRTKTACGLPHKEDCLPEEFDNIINKFFSLKSERMTNCWRGVARNLLTESGAKYKPSRLANEPDLLLELGAYFYNHLNKLEIRPNVLIINSQLAVPLAMSLYLNSRYSSDESVSYHVVMMNETAGYVSGLQQLMEYWGPEEKNLRCVSVTVLTAHGDFEVKAWKAIKEKVNSFNQANPDQIFNVEKIATLSLFDLEYMNDSDESVRNMNMETNMEAFSNYISIVKL